MSTFAPNENKMNNHLRHSPNTMIPSAIPIPNLPPPLPPRPSSHHQTNYTNYMGYPDQRGYASNYYGSYPYGGNNYYRTPPYYNGDTEYRLMNYAEGNIRTTFQSLETILQTFSSLTTMMESTYFAITNSFRALVTVAASVDRLRTTLGQILSTFALIRLLKWTHRRILHAFGMARDLDSETLWEQLTAPGASPESNNSWSGAIMFAAIVVIPYLINRILKNLKNLSTPATADPKEWFNEEDPVRTATALYDFTSSQEEELSIKVGQKLWLAPSSLQPKHCPGWCRATDSVNVGLVPSNYLTVVGQLKKKSNNLEQDSTTTL